MAQKTIAQRDRDKRKTAKAAIYDTKPNSTAATNNFRPKVSKADDLTFITSEGKIITFPVLEMPMGEATAIASEESLSTTWNRAAEDSAWRDL